MKLLSTFLSLCAAFLLSGCLQVDSLLVLKTDGSGTITQTVTMKKEALEQITAMSSGLGGKKKDAKPFSLMDETVLKEAAAKMGEGVTFESSKKITGDGVEGFTAVYQFKDISKLKLNQNPAAASAAIHGGSMKNKDENLTFLFVKNAPSPSKLTIKMPESAKKKDGDKKPGGEVDKMAMQMMQQMFKDMKMSLVIQVEGQIADTNAEFVDGKRVTLADIDFNKLLSDPAKVEELAKSSPKTLEEGKALLRTVPGIKVDGQQEITIRFQ